MAPQKQASLEALCRALGARLGAAGLTVAVAESCTGGLVAASWTAVPGSSAWFEMGFVTYSPRAKRLVLGLPEACLGPLCIVSSGTACAMALAAQALSDADVALGITGFAGPTGGSPSQPVGTVVIAWANRARAESETFYFPGDRHAVRMAAVVSAVSGLIDRYDAGFLARP